MVRIVFDPVPYVHWQYRDGVVNTVQHLLPKLIALIAISNGARAVKLLQQNPPVLGGGGNSTGWLV